MKTRTLFISLSALCPLATALLTAVCGNAATPDDAAARSVKDLKLRISPNGRYFVDQGGKPFFYLGDTCWLLFQRPNREEVDEYLRDRAAKGFTVIQAYVLRGLGKKHPDGNSSLLDAPPLLDRDPTRPNEEFFKNVDYVVNRANELGLVMGLVTAKSWHVTDHPEKVFDEKKAYLFGKFLGERYKNNAVMWFPGGDSPPEKYEEIWVAMAKGLKDGSGGGQLVCYHGQGSTSSSMWFHKADWLDFNSIQSGHHFGSDSYAFVSKDYALTPAKPTVDMEPAYENHPTGANKPRIDAHKVRSQAYSAMLAGAAGHGYGALDLFWFKVGDPQEVEVAVRVHVREPHLPGLVEPFRRDLPGEVEAGVHRPEVTVVRDPVPVAIGAPAALHLGNVVNAVLVAVGTQDRSDHRHVR